MREAARLRMIGRTDLLRRARGAARNPRRNVYFGDLHVHTSLSFDAHLFGNRFGPDEAYRFASGNPLSYGIGETAVLSRPLDFVALTDHAESTLDALCGGPSSRLPRRCVRPSKCRLARCSCSCLAGRAAAMKRRTLCPSRRTALLSKIRPGGGFVTPRIASTTPVRSRPSSPMSTHRRCLSEES